MVLVNMKNVPTRNVLEGHAILGIRSMHRVPVVLVFLTGALNPVVKVAGKMGFY